jgi:5-methylcytosine-specific restriction endonuclease McrA
LRKVPKYPLRGNEPEVLFDEHKGICHICHFPIDPVRTGWHVGHVITRSCGGSDDWSNLAPAHKSCNLARARQVENTLAAKIKRVRLAHSGPRKRSRWSEKYQEAKSKGYDPWRKR